jgi:hypothetical protein
MLVCYEKDADKANGEGNESKEPDQNLILELIHSNSPVAGPAAGEWGRGRREQKELSLPSAVVTSLVTSEIYNEKPSSSHNSRHSKIMGFQPYHDATNDENYTEHG